MSKDTKAVRDIEEPRKKQGRPKKEATKKNIVTTYLRDDENEKFREIVEESGLTVAAFMRNLIMAKI